MADLAQLALNRIRGQLPTFSGATFREQLDAGRAQARSVLLKYVPSLDFDTAGARDVMSGVNAWVDRNRNELEQALQAGSQTLPEYLVLNMGSSDRVQQWVVANYTLAAAGLGPWDAGKIDQLVADSSSQISPQWAEVDAGSRINVFAMIVKMENDGDLAYIFRGPEAGTGTQGFGAVLPVWAIVVLVVALAAVVAYFYIESRRLEVNNALMRDICARAQAEGDEATVRKCIEATRDLQLATPWQTIVNKAGQVALVLGGGYLLFRYGLPWLLDRRAPRRLA